MSLAEQKRLLGIGLSVRDSVYLIERQKASKLKDAVEAFKHALKLRKKGKISSKQLDAAENAALDAGADFDEIDKLRSEAVKEFDIGDKVRAKKDLCSSANRLVAKGFVGRVVGINERQVDILTTPLTSESFDADDWEKVKHKKESLDEAAKYSLYQVALKGPYTLVLCGTLKQISDFANKRGLVWKRSKNVVGGYYANPRTGESYEIR